MNPADGNARFPEPSDAAARWRFLEALDDACAVITRRMEVLYVNDALRSLVPEEWFGRRCWEVFPVKDTHCVSACPAARVASSVAEEIAYCEETVYPGDDPLVLGVALIPLGAGGTEDRGAILLLRPVPSAGGGGEFRATLLDDAARLRSSIPGDAGSRPPTA